MQEVVSVKTMRESDEATIKTKTPSLELMKMAGEAVYNAYNWKGRTAIVCGGGNNAGDGYVLASLLGDSCHVFLLWDKFSSDGKFYFDECVKMGVEYSFVDEDTDFSEYDTIVDCIFGTGFKSEVEGLAKAVIDKINQSGKCVVSVDIPSGLNGDTGVGYCVISDLTVSIGTIKTGLILNEAKDKIKRLINCPIGIDIVGEKYYLLEKEDFVGMIPKRKHHSHKGTYGYTALWGGCEEYSGAVKLANLSLSALKSGCGVNKLIVCDTIAQSVAPYLLESTLFKMPQGFDKDKIDEALKGVKCLAVGMGWGKGEGYEDILYYILDNYDINVIIDADGLNTLSNMDLDILKRTKCKVCLTPHVKEFSRLAKINMREVNFIKAREFAKEYSVIVLLKGTATAVTDGEDVYFVNRGCPGMATAGSGDVLSGILCGLGGYMDMNARMVSLGAYIASCAGEAAESEINAVSMTSSDTVRNIGKVIGEIYGY